MFQVTGVGQIKGQTEDCISESDCLLCGYHYSQNNRVLCVKIRQCDSLVIMAGHGKFSSRAACVDVSEMQELGVLEGGSKALDVLISCMAN